MACVSTSVSNDVDVSEDREEMDRKSSTNLHYAMTTGNIPRPALLTGTTLKVDQASDSNPDESTVTDSGYASALSTPESLNRTAEASQKDGIEFSLAKILKRKITRLREFDKIVPAAAQDRFKDLNELFGKPLSDYVTKSGATFSAISIKLKVLGESEDSTKLWIVVLCDKGVTKRVKRFFSQPWVKSECQPCDNDPGRPSFEILVYDRPPIPIAMTSSASVYADWRGDASKCLTLCGSIIRVNTESNTRLATLGGVLSVTMADGNTELYCMTVSHVVAGGQLEKDAYKSEEVSSDAEGNAEEEDSDDATEAVFLSGENQEYTLDLGFEGERDSSAIGFANQDPSSADSTPPLKIGYVAITSHDALEDGGNLDWALIKIDDPSLYCPNLLLIPGDTDQSHFLYEVKDISFRQYRTALSVFLLSGTRGVIRGMLSLRLSSLMLAPGKRFTDTYTLRLSNGLDLNAGDCGSWVVDSFTYEVYGHVVASDDFGEAYIIPIKNTFRCILKQLSAQRVYLPYQHEGQERIRQKVDEPANDAQVESSIHLLGSTIEEQSGETCSGPDVNWFTEVSLGVPMRPDAGFDWAKQPVDSPGSQVAGSARGPTQEDSFSMAQAEPRKVASSSADPDIFSKASDPFTGYVNSGSRVAGSACRPTQEDSFSMAQAKPRKVSSVPNMSSKFFDPFSGYVDSGYNSTYPEAPVLVGSGYNSRMPSAPGDVDSEYKPRIPSAPGYADSGYNSAIPLELTTPETHIESVIELAPPTIGGDWIFDWPLEKKRDEGDSDED